MAQHTNLIADYQSDGCIRIRKLLDARSLEDIRAQLDRYTREIVPDLPPGDRTFEADGVTVRNLWRMEQHDAFFAQLAARKDIVELIASLFGGEPVLIGVETFNKPAKVGSGVPPHQDNAYFCQTPPDVLTLWIAIDAVTNENGPVFYLKGSHTRGVLPHRPSGVAGNSMGLVKMPAHADADEFCGTLDAGDAMIHHSQTIHWSAANKTDRSRCGLLMVYRAASTQYDPKLKAAYDAARAVPA